MDGLLLVNKPKWYTSFNMIARVRRIIKTQRVGHAGTLDPFASGLLLIAVGKGVRVLEYLQGLPKSYEATLCLGKVSTSYDPEGEITERGSSEHITKDHIEEVLLSFRGKISQRPPIFSAIRIQGKRAYNFARKGKEVNIPLREVEIRSLEIMDYTSPYLTLYVECSSGTYIRSLAHDIGEVLGVGAYLTDLKRTSIDGYCLDQSVRILDDSRHADFSCLEKCLIPLQKMHFGLPVVYFTEEKKQRFSQGLPISAESLSLPADVRFEVREEGSDHLLGIAELKEGYIKTYKMLI